MRETSSALSLGADFLDWIAKPPRDHKSNMIINSQLAHSTACPQLRTLVDAIGFQLSHRALDRELARGGWTGAGARGSPSVAGSAREAVVAGRPREPGRKSGNRCRSRPEAGDTVSQQDHRKAVRRNFWHKAAPAVVATTRPRVLSWSVTTSRRDSPTGGYFPNL